MSVESGRSILEGGSKLIHAIYHEDITLGLLDSEDEDTTIVHNISNHTHNKTVSHHMRIESSTQYQLQAF
jgi:hypothetical protein